MPAESFEQLLDRAASEMGIEPGYWDIWGKHHTISTAGKQAILQAMGVPCGSAAELEEALARRARRSWERWLPPCIVAGESGPHSFPLNVPAESLGEAAVLTLRREDGSSASVNLNLWDLPQAASVETDGRTIVLKQVPVPEQLPLGYHEISLRIGSHTAGTRYIVTPERAWSHPHLGRGGRVAGLALSLYGLRSGRNWGCGDFTDLLAVIDWASMELEVSFIALNPLHAIHNRRPFNTSPYLPNCIFYQNFLYLDVEAIEDFPRCRRARELRQTSDICVELEALRAAEFVEYERVSALKLRFLKLLFVEFRQECGRARRNGTECAREKEFRAFQEREGALLGDFATYCALDEYLRKRNPDVWVWPQWPAEYQDPNSTAVQQFRKKHFRSVLFYQYLQWQIDRQLRRAQERALGRGLPIGLYHDLALATDQFGSDLWAHRPFYITGCRVGAPPDDFSPAGQDWGFPPPRSEQHRENGYQLFVESIRKNCRHGGALRIDHVMRLFRLYWIPDEASAAEGAYVREQSDDYLRLLALESVRNRVVVIGEDLGTVEPEVRETLARRGILSYRLFYFEQNKRGEFLSAEEYPEKALVTSTTHDLPTVAGFWVGADIESRRQAGVLDGCGYSAQLAARQIEKQKILDLLFREGLLAGHLPRSADAYPELTGDLHYALVGFLARTPSQLMAINQEDLTKEIAQQNLPGTTWQYPNWGRKMKFTMEQLRDDPAVRAFTAMIRNWIVNSGRSSRAAEID